MKRLTAILVVLCASCTNAKVEEYYQTCMDSCVISVNHCGYAEPWGSCEDFCRDDAESLYALSPDCLEAALAWRRCEVRTLCDVRCGDQEMDLRYCNL